MMTTFADNFEFVKFNCKKTTNMDRPPKRHTDDESSSQPRARTKGEKWTQAEMETLASLCVAHGQSGILSKRTDKVTTMKKDSQWITVRSMFNSMHPPRDKSALLARYKFIIMYLRKGNTRERRNYYSKKPFEVTKPMQELANMLGLPVIGMDRFGTVVPMLLTANTSSRLKTSTCDTQLLLDASNVDFPYIDNGENSGSFISGNESQDADVDESQGASSHTETEAIHPNDADGSTTPFPDRSKFFATTSKRRSAKRMATSTHTSASAKGRDILEARIAYLVERKRHANERHAAKMDYERAVLNAKLEEMRQEAMERQTERRRRAELHSITMRHKEALFDRKLKLLKSLGSVLSFAMENTGVSSVGLTADDGEISAEQFQPNKYESTESNH